MAGGIWETQSKVRPGAYINAKSAKKAQLAPGNGIVALPLEIDFGISGEIFELTTNSDFTMLGYDLTDSKLLLVHEALKRAGKVLTYRVTGGTEATKTEGDVTITALYKGTRGNAIKVVSAAVVDDPTTFIVKTFIDTIEVDIQRAKNIDDLKTNAVVSFSGTGTLTAFEVKLSGATDVTATNQDYLDFFEKLEIKTFDTLALPISDETTKTAAYNFIKRMRDEEGKKCQLVAANMPADDEAVINVKNGVVLADGTKLTKEQATAWVAGATAAATEFESLTYTTYDGAIDANPRLTNSATIDALRLGEFVFTEKRGTSVVEQDINSLLSFTDDKNELFSKNRILRTSDKLANHVREQFEDNFIGKVTNDESGRDLFKGVIIAKLDEYTAGGAIEAYETEDIQVHEGAERDSVVAYVAYTPLDSMEKLYMTIELS